MSKEFSADAQRKLQALCDRYLPAAGSKQPVVMAALHLAQKEHGALDDEALQLVARTLELPYAHVYGVATFYTMYRRQTAGTNVLRVCTNISCMLRGGYEVMAALEQHLGIKKGQTTTDGAFTIVEEECLAACANAPAVVCGTEYFLDVRPEQAGDIVGRLRATPRPEGEVV
ncbi:MAG: NADH-quinone oxidoreductase subunit NuoE [Kofleriaceae bacterium]